MLHNMMAAADEPPPYAMVAGAVPAHTTAPGVASRVVAPTGPLPPPALTARDADLLRSWKFFTNEFQRRNLFFQIDNPRKLGTSEVNYVATITSSLCLLNVWIGTCVMCVLVYVYLRVDFRVDDINVLTSSIGSSVCFGGCS